MWKKRVIVPVGGPEAALGVLRATFAVAQRFGGHVDGLHARSDPGRAAAALAMDRVSAGIASRDSGEVLRTAEREAALREEGAHRRFDEVREAFGAAYAAPDGPREGISASWTVVDGSEPAVLAERGRLFDLIVVPQPSPGADNPALATLDAVLFDSGRPVLVVPQRQETGFGETVVIAWNRSARAARAVHDAMPFLLRARQVVIVTVRTEAKSGPPADELARYLDWHGIPVAVREVAPDHRDVGDILLYEARNCAADLIVMGAYGRSRLRELLLGGVTYRLASEADTPVLACH